MWIKIWEKKLFWALRVITWGSFPCSAQLFFNIIVFRSVPDYLVSYHPLQNSCKFLCTLLYLQFSTVTLKSICDFIMSHFFMGKSHVSNTIVIYHSPFLQSIFHFGLFFFATPISLPEENWVKIFFSMNIFYIPPSNFGTRSELCHLAPDIHRETALSWYQLSVVHPTPLSLVAPCFPNDQCHREDEQLHY